MGKAEEVVLTPVKEAKLYADMGAIAGWTKRGMERWSRVQSGVGAVQLWRLQSER